MSLLDVGANDCALKAYIEKALKRFWGYPVCRMTWKKRLRYWRYRGLLRLLNLDFASGILVVGEKAD
jgi:hypothetical protein